MAAKKTTSRTSKTPRTKAEVSSAYEDIAAEVRSTEKYDVKTAAALRAHEDSVRNRVAGLTVEAAVESVTKANLGISRTLSEVQQKLAETVQELQTVSEAVDLKKEELEQLHKIDIAQTALDTLVSEYEAKASAFEAEVKAKRDAWVQEQLAHSKAVAERDSDLAKARQREQAEYDYNLKISRQKEKDTWEAQVAQHRKAEAELQEKFDKALQVRNDTMNAREAEFESFKAQVADFPNRIKAETDKAVAVATNSLKAHYTNEAALLKANSESDKKILTFQIESLNKDVIAKNNEIAQLRQSLEAANQRVTEIAGKAFEATSGQLALDRVTQLTARGENGNGSRPKA